MKRQWGSVLEKTARKQQLLCCCCCCEDVFADKFCRCQREHSCALLLVYRLRILTQILLWEPESAEMHSKDKRVEGRSRGMRDLGEGRSI